MMQLIGIIIGAAATILAVFLQYYLSNKKSKGQKCHLAYIRLMHLKKRHATSSPIYKTFIKRLNKYIDVYDEFHLFSTNVFYKQQSEYRGTFRSSGVIDLFVYYPWQSDLFFSDKDASLTPDYIDHTISKKSDLYITRCAFYNGLQDGYEDVATKFKYDTELGRLIIDFSSLRSEERLLVATPKSFYRDKEGNESPIATTMLNPGVYMAEIQNGKQGEVLRMDLTINWNPTYVFGYGSLINMESAQKIKESVNIPIELIEAYLVGYKRIWNISDNIFSTEENKCINAVFLNLAKENYTSVNGVLIPVNDEELSRLIIREKNYTPIDITQDIRIPSGKLTSGTFRVYTFVGKNQFETSNKAVEDFYIMGNYIQKVLKGCSMISQDFLDEFNKTTIEPKFKTIKGSYKFLEEEQNKLV